MQLDAILETYQAGWKRMKAIVYTKYGPPDVLEFKDVTKPILKDNEVLVSVKAATVNRTDCATVRAKPFFMRLVTGLLKPKKPITGTDFAGTIEALGKNVSSFKIGDRVFGFDDIGLCSHAEYLTISEDGPLTTIPDNIGFEQAAASTEGAHYAINFINKVSLESGQRFLVNGATGAIGSATVQFLKTMDVHVTAVCGTDNIELVKSFGADRVIDYLQQDFTKEDQMYNYIFDTVGKSSFLKCRPLLQPGGCYISSELGWMAQNLFLASIKPIIGNRKVLFPIPLDIKASLVFIKNLMQQGKFNAVIDKSYPLHQIVEAFRYVETGQKIGNIVITIGPESDVSAQG